MNKYKVEQIYKQKINLLKTYNKAYFDKNTPIVSDKDYDELKRDILLLEKENDFIKSKDSPSNVVGYKPSKNFKKVPHRIPMLSLANAFNEDDLLNFEKKILNFLSKDENTKIFYTAEPKIDGISASLIYKNKKLIRGLSRGDGKEGEDITSNLITIKDIPKEIFSNDFP